MSSHGHGIIYLHWAHLSVLVEGRFTRVPSPTHVSKSQHEGTFPTCEPQVTTKIWLIITKFKSWLIYAKIFAGPRLRVGSSFLLSANASPKPYLQKMMSCRHPCHNLDLGLGIPCELALNVTSNQQYTMA
jgi:hypothetical protein